MKDRLRFYIAGHGGLVGSALRRRLEQGTAHVLTAERESLDLRCQADVERWFAQKEPDCVIVAAGRVGGILPNSVRRAEFLYDNLIIAANMIHAAYQSGVAKLLYLGSSCAYPRQARQPIREEDLLSGPLEPTNEPYAVAKIAGVKLCQAYRRQYGCRFLSFMPTNLYGPGDNFDEHSGHVLPALIARFHRAKYEGTGEVVVWGSGRPRRELLHVDDLAEACLFLLDHYDGELSLNIGTGEDVSIAELADLVREVVYPEARIVFDRSKPDGIVQKRLDVRRLHALGWRHRIGLEEGILRTYAWFVQNVQAVDHGDRHVL